MAQTQLTLAQRYKISALLQARMSNRRIAEILDVHHSSVCREVKRNSQHGRYNAEAAEKLTMTRRQQANKNHRISNEVWHIVDKFLELDFSPEQIAGLLNRSGEKVISHESIYQHVLQDKTNGGTLWKHLRWSRKKRRKRYGKQDRRGIIPDRVSIDERPAIVDSKGRVGDWEIDTAIGKGHQGVLVVAVERKTHVTLIGHAPYKKSSLVSKEIIRMLKPYKNRVLTITVDNGKEFTEHKKIAKALDTCVYFAHPYSAWERGLNENTIGLMRQYFPKSMSLRTVNRKTIYMVQDLLNIRPRKTLEFRSPAELFFGTVAFGT